MAIFKKIAEIIKLTHRNKPDIWIPKFWGNLKKGATRSKIAVPTFYPHYKSFTHTVNHLFRKNGGPPYIDYVCVFFYTEEVSVDRRDPWTTKSVRIFLIGVQGSVDHSFDLRLISVRWLYIRWIRTNPRIHPIYHFFRFSLKNDDLGLKIKILKFLRIQPNYIMGLKAGPSSVYIGSSSLSDEELMKI